MTNTSYNIFQQITSVRVISDVNLSGFYFNGPINNGIGSKLTSLSFGKLIIDSISLELGDRILLLSQTNSNENGIYVVNQVGSISSLWEIERSPDFQSVEQLKPGQFFTTGSGSLAGNLFVLIEPLPSVIGLSSFNFKNVTGINTGLSLEYVYSQGSNANVYLVDNRPISFNSPDSSSVEFYDDITDKSVVFEVKSTDRGSKPYPIMTNSEKLSIATPTAGLTVFVSDNNTIQYYDGTSWEIISNSNSYDLQNVYDNGNNADINLSNNRPVSFINLDSSSRIDINDDITNSSEFFTITSTTSGSRPYPIMTNAQKLLIDSPSEGLIVFVSDHNIIEYYDGVIWQTILSVDNLVAGSNITLNPNGDGTITISSTGGSISGSSDFSGNSVIDNATSTTIASMSTLFPISVNSGNFNDIVSSNFVNEIVTISSVNTPTFRYIDSATQYFEVNINMNVRGTINSPQDYTFQLCIYKANTTIVITDYASSCTLQDMISKFDQSISGIVQLSEGDRIFVQVKNNTSANNILINSMNAVILNVNAALAATLQSVYDAQSDGGILETGSKPIVLRNTSGTGDNSTLLDMISTTRGSRPFPSMTDIQFFSISSPAQGLISYVTNDLRLYLFDGTDYQQFSYLSDLPSSSSPLSPDKGGTGVNNGINIISIGGNLSTDGDFILSGNFPLSMGITGTTNVTLPTSGTLVPTTGTGATGTWNINISGNSSTVTTNANLTGDVTSVGNATTLSTVNSDVGTFGDGTHISQVTVNAKGLITSASNVLITGAPPTGSAGGDLTGTYPNPVLSNVNSNVGTFGDSTHVSQFTVNAKGLITSVSNVLITGAPPTGSAGGDLTGTYPNPTIGSNKVINSSIRQSIAFSVIGNSSNSTSNVADISATLNGTVLRLSGSTLGFGPLDLSLGGSSVTNSLGVGNGGTSLNSTTTGAMLYGASASSYASLAGNFTTNKQYLSQSGNGTTPNAPSWSSISGSDVSGSALTTTNDTNVTLTLGGTPSTSLLRSVSLTLGWSGLLSVIRGGTNSSSQFTNGVIYFNGTALTSNSGFLFNGNQVSMGSGSPVSGTILTVIRDDSTTAPQQLVCTGNTNQNKQISIGYNTTSNYGSIQSQIIGTGVNPLILNPSGGNIGINTTTPNGTLQFANATNTRTIVLYEVTANDNQSFAIGVNSGLMRFQVSDSGTDFRFFAGLTSSTSQECFRIRGNQTFASFGSGNIYNNNLINFYTDAGSTLRGYVGDAPTVSDISLVSIGSGNFLRFGSNAALIGFWMDNNVTANNSPNISFLQTGDVSLNVLGGSLKVKQGSNAASGTVTLVGATTTVITTAVHTGDLIFFNPVSAGGTPGFLTYTINNGTFFTITSSTGALDTRTIAWLIVKSA